MSTTIHKFVTIDDAGNAIVPVGAAAAGRHADVVVTIVDEQATDKPPLSNAAWHDFLRRSAGSIDDPTFIRHPQGDPEAREPID